MCHEHTCVLDLGGASFFLSGSRSAIAILRAKCRSVKTHYICETRSQRSRTGKRHSKNLLLRVAGDASLSNAPHPLIATKTAIVGHQEGSRTRRARLLMSRHGLEILDNRADVFRR